jgi:hypothetical protein
VAGRRGEGSLSFEHRGECQNPKWHRGCAGLWRGVTSEVLDGKRVRVKVSAKTKTEAQAKLKAKLDEQRRGIRSSGTYAVRQCLEDWPALRRLTKSQGSASRGRRENCDTRSCPSLARQACQSKRSQRSPGTRPRARRNSYTGRN